MLFQVLTLTVCPSRVIEAVPRENVVVVELAPTETESKKNSKRGLTAAAPDACAVNKTSSPGQTILFLSLNISPTGTG